MVKFYNTHTTERRKTMRMEKRRWLWFAVILAVLAGFTAPAFAGSLEQGAAPGPTMRPLNELSQPWDQILPVSERFKLVMGGAAVLDKETGLVWEQSPAIGTFPWDPDWWIHSYSAVRTCNDRIVGGRMGWRLSTLQELTSLVDPSVSGYPKLPSGHPFSNVQSSNYWSATTDAYDTTLAWSVNFESGNVGNYGKANALYVWCVRGGQGRDDQ